jgi:tight adherence protein C
MLYIVVISIGLFVTLLVVLIADAAPGNARLVQKRLVDVQTIGEDPHSIIQRRRRHAQRQRIIDILEEVGSRLQGKRAGTDALFLQHAGYRHPAAPAIYFGMRLVLAVGLFVTLLFLGPIAGWRAPVTMLAAIYMGAMGWIVPVMTVRIRKKSRQHEIQLALADALDLLVICVEAGLGLNQALMRVSHEIKHVSMVLSAELALVNAEIRAGIPRDVALGNLSERTGVEDLRSLVTMLVQTDRFGTSVARSLRVHSDTLRQKRRQRAEEAAAKTAIKMVFPLVFCIFPALFVVILGPGLIQIVRALSGI